MQYLPGFSLLPYVFFHSHNSKEFHRCTTHLHEELAPFAAFEPRSCLVGLSSCVGRDSKWLVSAHLLYVAKDFLDLYSTPLRSLFSIMNSSRLFLLLKLFLLLFIPVGLLWTLYVLLQMRRAELNRIFKALAKHGFILQHDDFCFVLYSLPDNSKHLLFCSFNSYRTVTWCFL